MRRVVLLLAAVVVSTGVAWGRYDASTPPPARTWGVAPGVVIVKLKPGVEPVQGRSSGGIPFTGIAAVDAASTSLRARTFEPVFVGSKRPEPGSVLRDLTRFYRLAFDAVPDPAQVAESIAQDPNVDLAEVVIYELDAQFIPNDVKFDSLWFHVDATDNDMDTPEAWVTQAGDPDVLIAIFDSGVLFSHLDLKN